MRENRLRMDSVVRGLSGRDRALITMHARLLGQEPDDKITVYMPWEQRDEYEDWCEYVTSMQRALLTYLTVYAERAHVLDCYLGWLQSLGNRRSQPPLAGFREPVQRPFLQWQGALAPGPDDDLRAALVGALRETFSELSQSLAVLDEHADAMAAHLGVARLLEDEVATARDSFARYLGDVRRDVEQLAGRLPEDPPGDDLRKAIETWLPTAPGAIATDPWRWLDEPGRQVIEEHEADLLARARDERRGG